MKIIEKVEIKHFRSFDGWVWQEKVEINDLCDFNIFSWANDSWKSNILRVLNLFFNNEISPWVPFDFERDLSKALRSRSDEKVQTKRDNWEKDVRQKDLWVKIRVYFRNDRPSTVIPEWFFIEKMWDKDWLSLTYRKHNIKSQSRTVEWKVTQFLNNIRFEYVPAVKDRQFFNYLFRKLQKFLFEKDKKFTSQSNEFNSLLMEQTIKLFEDFKISSGIDASFIIPDTLIDFFRTLSVVTNQWVSLFDRWDWVQARFIPEILNEISRETKKKIIWWFEEPENSYESRNIRKLRDDFLNNYSQSKQIFITTHSGEFLSISSEKVSLYRVFKLANNTSQVVKFNEDNYEWERICDDLWIIMESRLIEKLQLRLSDETKLIESSEISKKEQKEIILKIENQFTECMEKLKTAEEEIRLIKKPSIFLEDEHLEIYKIAWLKLNWFSFDVTNFISIFDKNCPFTFNNKNWKKNLFNFLDCPWVTEWNWKKVIGIFDFDEAFNDFNWLTMKSWRWNVENWTCEDWLYKRRTDHPCFCAVLIPVPVHRTSYASLLLAHNSILEIELYFSDIILDSLGCLIDKPIPWWPPVKVFNSKKKWVFWKDLFDIPEKEFTAFHAFFSRIEDLLK
jgi:hypothetical protein